MGNQLAQLVSEHTVAGQVASGGPSCLWRVYSATRKANNEAVSLFVFDKAQLDKLPKATKDAVLGMLRHEVQLMTKLRHPRLLSILRPATETKKVIMFETEPMFASLANILRNYSNLKPVPRALEVFKLEPLEIKIGLMHVAEAMDFLHNHANIIHRNITPFSIFVTRKGEWKLGGFNFATYASYKPGQRADTTTNMKEYNVVQSGFATTPLLDYLAPEYVYTQRYDYLSDVFSLGCVAYEMHASQRLLINQGNTLSYKGNVEQLAAKIDWRRVPVDLHDTLRALLCVDPRGRANVRQFLASKYFNDILLRSIAFLGTLMQKENGDKAAFFKGFQGLLPSLPPRIVEAKVLPPLLQELRNDLQLLSVLPLLFTIIQGMPPSKFRQLVLPHLVPIFSAHMLEKSLPVVTMVMKHLPLLLEKCEDPELHRQHILPMLVRMLESGQPHVQDVAIRQVPVVAKQIEFLDLKQLLLPRVQALVAFPEASLKVRLNGIVCFSMVAPVLDKATVADMILPTLHQLATTEHEPRILTALLHCYSVVAAKVGPEYAVVHLLPPLLPLCANMNLDAEQFSSLMKVVKGTLKSVEEWRGSKFTEHVRVQQQLKKDDSTQFEKHRRFEDLVASDFQEMQQRKGIIAAQPAEDPPVQAAQQALFQAAIEQERISAALVQKQEDQELVARMGGASQKQVQDASVTIQGLSISGRSDSGGSDFGSDFGAFSGTPDVVFADNPFPASPAPTRSPLMAEISPPGGHASAESALYQQARQQNSGGGLFESTSLDSVPAFGSANAGHTSAFGVGSTAAGDLGSGGMLQPRREMVVLEQSGEQLRKQQEQARQRQEEARLRVREQQQQEELRRSREKAEQERRERERKQEEERRRQEQLRREREREERVRQEQQKREQQQREEQQRLAQQRQQQEEQRRKEQLRQQQQQQQQHQQHQQQDHFGFGAFGATSAAPAPQQSTGAFDFGEFGTGNSTVTPVSAQQPQQATQARMPPASFDFDSFGAQQQPQQAAPRQVAQSLQMPPASFDFDSFGGNQARPPQPLAADDEWNW